MKALIFLAPAILLASCTHSPNRESIVFSRGIDNITIDLKRSTVTVNSHIVRFINCSNSEFFCISSALEGPTIYFPKECSRFDLRPPIKPATEVASDPLDWRITTIHPNSPKFLVEYKKDMGVVSLFYDYDGEGRFDELVKWDKENLDYLDRYKYVPDKDMFSCISSRSTRIE